MKAVSAPVVSCCAFNKPIKKLQQLHGNISYMFNCWADPVVHLILLKRSMCQHQHNLQLFCLDYFFRFRPSESAYAWSSLVEGDEQLNWPNSQITLELCHACAANFLGFNINTTAYCLGRCSLHLLLLKSSMAYVLLLLPLLVNRTWKPDAHFSGIYFIIF